MKTQAAWFLVVLALVLALMHSSQKVGQSEAVTRIAKQQVTKWKAAYAEKAMHVVHDSVHLTRWATKYDTVRDGVTVHLTDTVWIKEAFAVADSTIHACRELVVSCSQLRVTADSTIKAQDELNRLLSKNQRKPWDRLGLFVGYGQEWGSNQRNLVIGVGLRILP